MKTCVHIEAIDTLPVNFPEFQQSIRVRVNSLYGADAAHSVQTLLRRNVAGQIHRSDMLTWAAVDATGTTVGLLAAALNGERARVILLHVLPDCLGQGIEGQLMTAAIESMRKAGIHRVLCDTLLGEDLLEPGIPEGLQAYPRIMMRSPVVNLTGNQTGTALVSMPMKDDQVNGIADCIISAYENHPDSRLYCEVRDREEAAVMIRHAMNGVYGQTSSRWIRALWNGSQCQGGIIGTRLFPHTVFVLQIFVRPECQRQGKGQLLFRELAEAVASDALENDLVLCVSADNPARNLYAKLGFVPLYATTAYLWQVTGRKALCSQ
jgi:ribosomal protein S18 acetylase RimI-like enzyme